ncbi:ATP-binding protein [Aromatoleum diolicum]|uniref:AAA family ATPase n=1 Tax=Aromatoleum diolicum TaxID=75796 RepID=A0ABX1QGW6_9RHOO|nr:ATP-binding protein [Aromatoleum diolicum]NMG77678.1 AAA family ATPase [Aromatoleum diolicum]
MNAPVSPRPPSEPLRDPQLDGARLSRAFVHAGITHFAKLSLGAPSAVFDALQASSGGDDLATLLGTPRDDWHATCTELARVAPQLRGPLGRLLSDLKLQLHEWFALALCGENESSYLLNLAVAELQSPGALRPGLHLIAAVSDALFDAPLPPLALPNHRLVRAGILELAGDGPMPTRNLAIAPELWALLCGDTSAWRDTAPLPVSDAVLPHSYCEQLPSLTTMLRSGVTQHVVFRGARAAGLAAAARLAATVGRPPLQMDAATWLRQPALAAACRYAGWLPVLALELGPGERHALPDHPALAVPLLIVTGRDGAVEGPALIEIDLPPLSAHERRDAWRAALPANDARVSDAQVNAQINDFAGHALLDGPTVHTLAERVCLDARVRGETPGLAHLRRARAGFGSERLRQLAQPVTREVGPDELVLPDDLLERFDALVARCRQREQLRDGLGASLAEPAPGVRALFCGESGAGKTLAASRLATLLGAPLFRVDLSAVMNKYIGESEKNLGRLLDEAAALDVILLIDEADALFGRRGEGKETGERYANMLTNFLLTRIEQHPGIVVLTSNNRGRIDSAFTRRFDAIMEFPPPGVAERLRIWQSHLGQRSPDAALCRQLASYCTLPGGHIRNAVLQAAALDPAAPHDGDTTHPIAAEQLVAALIEEYRKIGRTPPPQLMHARGTS